MLLHPVLLSYGVVMGIVVSQPSACEPPQALGRWESAWQWTDRWHFWCPKSGKIRLQMEMVSSPSFPPSSYRWTSVAVHRSSTKDRFRCGAPFGPGDMFVAIWRSGRLPFEPPSTSIVNVHNSCYSGGHWSSKNSNQDCTLQRLQHPEGLVTCPFPILSATHVLLWKPKHRFAKGNWWVQAVGITWSITSGRGPTEWSCRRVAEWCPAALL